MPLSIQSSVYSHRYIVILIQRSSFLRKFICQDFGRRLNFTVFPRVENQINHHHHIVKVDRDCLWILMPAHASFNSFESIYSKYTLNGMMYAYWIRAPGKSFVQSLGEKPIFHWNHEKDLVNELTYICIKKFPSWWFAMLRVELKKQIHCRASNLVRCSRTKRASWASSTWPHCKNKCKNDR